MARILYLTGSPIPSKVASSVHVMKMCQAFVDNGHAVTLVAAKEAAVDDEVPDLFRHYGVRGGFRMHKTSILRHRMIRPHRVFDALQVNLLARRHRADLVYARCNALPYFPVERIRAPLILEGHFSRSEVDRIRAIGRLPNLRHFVVISEALAGEWASRYGIARGQVRVAHDAADAEPYMPPSEHARLRVGYVGSLYSGRGTEILLACARACPWADFVIAGGRPEELARWRTILAEAPIPNLTLLGYLPPSQTHALRSSCDVLVAPYAREVKTANGADTARWMSPLKVFEYMAAGRAIVASNLPALREVLTDEELALLVEPDEVSAWVRSLTRLRDDVELRRRLGDAARRRLEAPPTWTARAAPVR